MLFPGAGAMQAGGLSATEAVAQIQSRPSGHGQAVLKALEEEIANRTATSVRELPISQVQPGMELAEDLHSRTGVLLVARGFVVTQGLLMKLQSMDVGVREPVRVVVAPADVGIHGT